MILHMPKVQEMIETHCNHTSYESHFLQNRVSCILHEDQAETFFEDREELKDFKILGTVVELNDQIAGGTFSQTRIR